ncbi:MAG: F0F1 ATP synthase subunit gamma [Alphaproteobacteria bacterium]|nr:F0F1 ATP synthase subunit gamma [Alphaproteobacteria bacterium]
MTERLADISARIDGIRQLGAVVNALKGIAAARARTARSELAAVDSYAKTIATAISSSLGPDAPRGSAPSAGRTGLLAFCAEQGFAGAFSERILDRIGDVDAKRLLLIGTRGLTVAAQRSLSPGWSAAMPSHTPGIPKLADAITRAVYSRLDDNRIDSLDVIHASWIAGRPQIVRRSLLPIDRSDFPPFAGDTPLRQLPATALMASLGADYLHALICKAALHAFAAENQARLEAMTSAGSQIARELEAFQAVLRRVRQEAITAEIIELGTGGGQAR